MEHLKEPKINCCSLHWIDIELDSAPSTYDEQLLKMGNGILLIFDWKEFFKILDASIEKSQLEYSRKKVEYYDPQSFNGTLTLHHKDKKYKYQNEYRILISHNENQPIKLPLPGLMKISHVIETRKYETIRVKKNENRN